MSHKAFKIFIVILMLGGIVLLQTVSPAVQAQASNPTAEQAVQSAWNLAKESASYSYSSNLAQTTYPAPSISNIGRPPRLDQFTVSGLYDQINQQMELELVNQHQERVQMRVNGTDAKGRTSADQEWQEFGAVNDFFAPGGDPLGFLAGATNIQTPSSTDSPQAFSATNIPLYSLPSTLYTFDFSGAAFGRFITEALTRQLIANGELMPDAQLQISDSYNRMVGSGQIWINEAGYPVQIALDLDLGTQESGEQVTAVVTLNYSDFTAPQDHLTFWQQPFNWTASQTAHILATPDLSGQIATRLAILFFTAAFVMVTIRFWHTRAYYNGLVSVLIFSMIASPFLEVGRAQGYQERLAPRLEAAASEPTEEEIASEAIGRHAEAEAWHPQQDPRAGQRDNQASPAIPVEAETLAAPAAVASNTVAASTDTDGDGVTDTLEDLLELCSGPSGLYCTGVADSTDSDGDGLSDGEEVNQLGTFGDRPDSDNDGITDDLEVVGFSYNGQQWHIDPNEQDTNKDGLTDAQECPVFVATDATYNVNGVCPDTDNNGTPDLFDHDNDGDGVPDGRDLSPNNASSNANPFSKTNPFELTVNNLATDQPVMVNLQLRPTNPDNLTYIGNVLDWPSPDVTGQIQRRFNTTFATTSNPEIRDTQSFNANYGDIRLVPLLEVQMPVAADHYANLPVLGSAPANRPSTYTVTQWLDSSKLTPYGISVVDSNDSGQLTAYVPLNIDTDATGGGRVAFNAQMVYYPSQGTAGVANWGAAHEYRLIWFVQMLTEECTDPANNATCTEVVRVIQVYDDEFTLTGMNIREEHGTKVAIMYENPAADSNLQMEDSLWEASYNLSNTFLRARDCATIVNDQCTIDNTRDVAIEGIGTFVNSFASATQPVTTVNFNYEHAGFITHVMMTETKKILNDHFLGYASQMNPTVLFAQEQDFRAYNLDVMSFVGGNQVTADMSAANAPRRIMGGLSWGPFTYNSTLSEWESADITNYVSGLETKLQSLTYFQPAGATPADEYEALGKVRLMQAYYLTLHNGLSSLLEVDGTPAWGPSNFLPEVFYGVRIPSATFTGATFTANYTLSGFVETFKGVANGERFVSSFLREMGKSYGSLANGQLNSVRQWSTLSNAKKAFVVSSNIAISAAALASLAGVAIFVTAVVTGDAKLQNIAVLILNSTTVVASSLVIISNTYFIMSLRTASQLGNVAKLSQMLQTGPIKGVTAIGFIFQVAVIWGIFAFTVRNIKPGTVQYDVAVANALAQTIVALIFVAIAALVYAFFILIAVAAPGAGTILVMAIYLIDAIIYLFTYFLSEVFGIGKPTSYIQELTRVIAEALYDVDMVIPNLDPTNRLQMSPSIALANDEAGFTYSNSALLSMAVTNTIGYNGAFSFERANDSVFIYNLEPTETVNPANHANLTAGQMAAQWQNVGGNQMQTSAVPTSTVNFADFGPGRDRNLDGRLYLIESFLVEYDGCWQTPVGEFCRTYNVKESIPLNVGSGQVFDILPDTIAEFQQMDWLGENNTPGQTSVATLAFTQDFDNDRLHASIDPNDRAWDTDGDGLGDYFERSKASDIANADADGDGLLDPDEFREGTDPLNPDTDGDGLNDYIETVEGWIIAYDGGTTRVWSNPLAADQDDDKLNDLEEYMFGFNPYVHTDPSLVDNLIQFDDFDVIETNAPVLYLPFDETGSTDTFADFSDSGQLATCDAANGYCPVAGVDGRFGQAIQLDGTNDFVEVAHDAAFNFDTNDDFTVAMWVKPDSTQQNIGPSLFEMWSGGNSSYPFVVRYNPANGTVYGARWDGTNNPSAVGSTSINDGQFHHIALTRLNGTLYLYVNGVLDGSVTDTTTGTTANISSIFIGNRETNFHFAGVIDEYVVYAHGMTAAQIQQVQAGNYNLNDLIFNPGDPFTYQATITNTNAARDADGVLIANSTYITPSLPNPTHFMEFEIDPNRTEWGTLATNGTITCALATCPTVDLGVATFDGVNDLFAFSSIEKSVYDTLGIQFDVYLDRALTVGEKMYIIDSILPTDSSQYANNYVDVYLEYETATTAKLVIDATFNTSETPVTAATYTGIPIGSWYQVDYFRDGGLPSDLKIGPGVVGNSLDNTKPFTGKLDNLRIYTREYQATGASTGFFYFVDQLAAEFNYYEELLYSTPSASELGQSLMDCTGDGCPLFERAGGRYGGGASFTSVTTETITLNNIDLAGDFSIAGWFNGRGILINSYADAAEYNNGTVPGFFINQYGANQLGASINTGSSTASLAGTIIAGWNHFALVRTANDVSLYMNGVLVDSAAVTLNLTDPGTLRIGSLTDVFAYTGNVDDFAVFDYALDSTQASLLASGKYPALEIDSAYVDFTIPAGTTLTPSGTGRIDTEAPGSGHRFNQIADVAYDTTLLSYSLEEPEFAWMSLLPFDELPGHVGRFEFVPASGQSYIPTNDFSFSCDSAATCPTTGVQAADRRGIYFDGTDDVISYGQPTPYGADVVSLWVNAERGTLLSGYVPGEQFTPELSFLLNMDGFSAISGNGCSISLPYSLPVNEWVHVIIAFIDNTANYYSNGQLVASQTVPDNFTCFGTSGIDFIGSDVNGNQHFKGYIDELAFITSGGLYDTDQAAAAQELYQKTAPLLRFGFDEESFDNVFADSNGRGRIGTPTALTQVIDGTSVTVPNPPLGTDGKIGNIAAFNGEGVITVDDPNNDIGSLTNDFTVMAWIRPTNLANENGYRAIMSPRTESSFNGFFFGTLQKKLTLSIIGVHTHQSTAEVNEDLWQHVAMTMDASNKVTFYINGVEVGSSTNGAVIANTDDPLYVGGRYSAGQIIQAFQGGIDELVVYGRTLNASEVTRDFLTGLRWYRDRGSQILTIDTDNPTVNLVTSDRYFPNSFTMLAVETFDPTSSVTLLDFGLKGPNDSGFTWRGAPACQDGAIGRVWCPSFNPTLMDGEGTYQVQFRAIDQVGNETTSQIYTLYIDDTPPTATSTHNGEWATLTPIVDRTNSWTVSLSGTVSDPTLSGGAAGSQVAADTVMIGLRGTDGRLLSGNRQQATVNGSNWTIDFNITTEQPVGTFTVELQAQDNLGNETGTLSVGTIQLDTLAPELTFEQLSVPAYISTTTNASFNGNVTDNNGRGVQAVEITLDPATAPAADALPTADANNSNWFPVTLNNGQWEYNPNQGIAQFENFYELRMRTTDNEGNTAEKGVQWRGLIDQLAPNISATAIHMGGNASGQTDYSFTITDFMLDPSSISQPCGAGDLTSLTYSTPSLPQDGFAYEISGTCRLPGRVAPQVSACDVAGNCTTVSPSILASANGFIVIDSPADGSQHIENSTINFSGTAYDLGGINSITLWANGSQIATASYSGNDTAWTASWSTDVTGTYTVTAISEGVVSLTTIDRITIDVIPNPVRDLFVMVDGTGSGLVTSNPAGIACGSDCTEQYLNGTEVTLTAAPNTGSSFAGWSGACSGTGSCVVTVNDVTNVTATFTLNRYALTVANTGTGTGTVTSNLAGINCGGDCSQTYDYGTVVTLTGAPSTGTTFSGWSGACSGTGNCVVTINDVTNVTANFTLNSYDLTVTQAGTGFGIVTSNPAGITCGNDCTQPYDHGTVVTLTASPNTGSTFTGWSGACTGTGSCVVTITDATNVTATFTLNSYDLTINKTGTGAGTVTSDLTGIDCGVDCTQSYNHGTIVTLEAVAGLESQFTGWSGACSGFGLCAVTMDEAKTVTANFALNSYSLTAATSGDGNGTISSNPSGIDCGADCTQDYAFGTDVTLTASPDGSSVFTGWLGDCVGQNCSLNIDSNKVVTATFAQSTYDLTVAVSGNGSDTAFVSSNPAGITCGASNNDCQQTYNYNTAVTLNASYDNSQMALVWGGSCGAAVGDSCTVTMDQLHDVTATFTRGLFSLGTNMAGNGNGAINSNPAGISCDQAGGTCSAAFSSGQMVTLTATAGLESVFTGWSAPCALAPAKSPSPKQNRSPPPSPSTNTT